MSTPPRPLPGRLVALLTIAIAAVTLSACGSTTNTNPYDPAFYATPSTPPTGGPGTVVRTETMAAPFDGSQAWRVMYTSTSWDGSPIVVTGMVFAPTSPAPAGGRPVVSWAHPTTGIVDS